MRMTIVRIIVVFLISVLGDFVIALINWLYNETRLSSVGIIPIIYILILIILILAVNSIIVSCGLEFVLKSTYKCTRMIKYLRVNVLGMLLLLIPDYFYTKFELKLDIYHLSITLLGMISSIATTAFMCVIYVLIYRDQEVSFSHILNFVRSYWKPLMIVSVVMDVWLCVLALGSFLLQAMAYRWGWLNDLDNNTVFCFFGASFVMFSPLIMRRSGSVGGV
ncbi:hypothetical protein SAMN05421799_1272 [Alicyclobacillus vulcanalis]|uniref:Uncharacterized protein n=1 Tax=Alicyclobacillus vulcanalis TaxID=252246 RepID=A0A1N7PXT5_9BACL|nr:hypothetical protein SAMN05421799_1272 [Alicyclobacillus vulcanalis]